MKWRQFGVVVAIVCIVPGCGLGGDNPADGISSQQIHRQSTEEFHTTLDTLYSNEKSDRKSLYDSLSGALGELDEVPVGTPEAIANAEAAKQAVEDEKSAAEAAANEPLAAAQAALAEATSAEQAFHKKAVVPKASGRCSDDGCGGSCGDCKADQVCFELYCRAAPECAGVACGNDGAGGVCGSCEEEKLCTKEGQCVDPAQDVVEEVCRPECRNSPEGPYEKVVKYAKNASYPGDWDWRKYDRFFDDVENLDAFVGGVKAKQALNDALIAEHNARASQIAGLETKIADLKEKTKASQAEEKAGKKALGPLKAAVKAAVREAQAAGVESTPGVQQAMGALRAQEDDLVAKKGLIAQLKTEQKAASAELSTLKKAHKKAEPIVKVAVAVKPHLQDTTSRYEGLAADWRAAIAAKAAAQAKMDETQAAVDAKLAEIAESFQPKLDAAQAVIDGLNAVAVPEGQRVALVDQITDLNDVLGVPVMGDPDGMLSRVGDVLSDKQDAIADLDERIAAAEAADEDDEDAEDVDTLTGWRDTLADQQATLAKIVLVTPALATSDARVRSLREAIVAERQRHGG